MKKNRKAIGILPVLSLSLGGVMVSLGFLELAVRIFMPKAQWFQHDSSLDWVLDEELGWENRPNLDVIGYTHFSQPVFFNTNTDGILPVSAERKRKAGTRRILLLGDSIVLGRSVPESGRLHSSLERILNTDKRKVEVFNAGVENYSTDQSYLRLKRLIVEYKPDIVIYGFCSNDFVGNANSRLGGFAKPRFVLTGNKLEYIKPPFISPRYQGNVLLASMPEVKIQSPWIRHWAVYQWAKPIFQQLLDRYFYHPDTLVAGIDSQLYFSQDFRNKQDFALLGRLLQEMDLLSKKNGAHFLFYSHPDLLEVWDPAIVLVEKTVRLGTGQYDRYALEKELKKVSLKTRVPFAPMIDFFRAQEEKGPFHLLPRDAHSNITGYWLTATRLGEMLGELGWIQ